MTHTPLLTIAPQAMLDLRSTYLNGDWDEFTAFRIKRETGRLYPHREILIQHPGRWPPKWARSTDHAQLKAVQIHTVTTFTNQVRQQLIAEAIMANLPNRVAGGF